MFKKSLKVIDTNGSDITYLNIEFKKKTKVIVNFEIQYKQ